MEFDVEYLKVRAKRYGLEIPLDGTCTFDPLATYQGLYPRRSYRLKDVVKDEEIIDWDEPSVNYGKI